MLGKVAALPDDVSKKAKTMKKEDLIEHLIRFKLDVQRSGAIQNFFPASSKDAAASAK